LIEKAAKIEREIKNLENNLGQNKKSPKSQKKRVPYKDRYPALLPPLPTHTFQEILSNCDRKSASGSSYITF